MNSDEQPCAQEVHTIASAAWADYSRLIVPADTEVLYKSGAHFLTFLNLTLRENDTTTFLDLENLPLS